MPHLEAGQGKPDPDPSYESMVLILEKVLLQKRELRPSQRIGRVLSAVGKKVGGSFSAGRSGDRCARAIALACLVGRSVRNFRVFLALLQALHLSEASSGERDG